MLNCSSATSQGSRWVWSITAEDVFTNTSEVSRHGCLQLFEHQPIVVRLPRSVRAVPVLDDDALEPLGEKRVPPSPQTSGHVRRQPHVLARREDTFEVSAPFEQGDLKQRLAIHLEEVERGKDLPRAELPGVGVALVVDFEIALVAPIVDQHAVDDRGFAVGVRDDRVVQLARAARRSAVPDETRVAVADPHEHACPRPLRLEDVAFRLRAFADDARPLRRDVRAEDRFQVLEYPALDIWNIRSIMRTPVRNLIFQRCLVAAASALLLTLRQGESPSPSPRRAQAASVSWRVPPRVYSPFRSRPRARPMAVPLADEAAATHSGHAWRRLFRARRD